MMPQIHHILSAAECEHIITIFEESKITETHRDTQILPYKNDKILKDLYKNFKMESLLNPDAMEIVKCPTGSKMDPHIDPNDKYAVVIYLNDNFEGGSTIIDNIMVEPRKGYGVLFKGGKLKHSVTEITKGVRYTVAIWYV